MTLYEFIALDEMEQAEAVWDGVHIADREDEEHRILLYQINSTELYGEYGRYGLVVLAILWTKHQSLHNFEVATWL
jgi:hypothetical protein